MALADLSPTELLATCLWGEARGEGHCGMVAVGCVIRNRTIAWRETLQSVILGKNQFTSMAGNGPDIPYGDPQYADALSIAADILAGEIACPDITNGACYYANLAIANSGWFETAIVADSKNHPQVAQIRAHTFFR